MNTLEILMISFALAADAFAVSICKGLSLYKIKIKDMLIVAIWFGVFQGMMALLGYLLGNTFESIVVMIDHWIAFVLLIYMGIKMIIESYGDNNIDSSLKIKTMLLLAIGTSIDAFSFGIAYACIYNINSYYCFLMIGLITFITSFIGVKIGNTLENKFGIISRRVGGILLILMGIKILIEHTN